MALLRRRTSNLLSVAAIVVTLPSLALAALALATRQEARMAALLAWGILAAAVHLASGERASRGATIFAALFSLPIAACGTAAYEAHARWGLPVGWGLAALAGAVVLFATIFLRALLAAGSADYPYDD